MSVKTTAVTCPSWCTVPPTQHQVEVDRGDHLFHLSNPVGRQALVIAQVTASDGTVLEDAPPEIPLDIYIGLDEIEDLVDSLRALSRIALTP